MRIAHYLKSVRLEDGGVVRAVLDMCMYQARAGQDVTLVTCDDTDVPRPWKDGAPLTPKVRRIAPPGFMAGLEPSFGRQLGPVIDACDVLHLHCLWDPAQVAFARIARDKGKPYIQTPHGMLADWSVVQKKTKKDIYFAMFGAKLLEGAALVHTTAQAELDQSQKRHPRTPGVVVPLVFDLEPYRTLSGPGPARAGLPLPDPAVPSLLYLSRLHYKKRPDLLIAAGARLREMGEDFRVVIGGPCDEAYDAQLRAYARQVKMEDRTTFLGMVPAALKPSLYEACDLFVLPTSMENFGFVYFESLSCQTPLVTTRGTDTWKELEASGGARIVDQIRSDVKDGEAGGGDVEELARTIGGLIRERGGLKPMGRAGRAWVLENLEPSKIVARFIAMYERAIKGGPADSRPSRNSSDA